MPDAPFGLSDKERAVLRLLTRGHDVKSAATALGLSVHTVNERLREARSKTGASSSRGAARLLAECEDPAKSVPTQIGVRAGPRASDPSPPPQVAATVGSRFPSRWEFYAMTILLAAIMIAVGLHGSARDAAPAAPRVVSTYPAPGATVPPGPLRLRVTFDRPMRVQSYSFVRRSAETYPDCGANQPVQSADGRSFTMMCRVQAGGHYEVWFNDPPYLNFADRSGVVAVPFGLRFATKAAGPAGS
ncbi:MAG: LuxR C-terminal-related transcriptional regulator [Sphingomonas phyllosphaerae]|uniref:LuxR C-terminal-related transcriptional regulator n=1 Tax=Sphingomonas phyllosphaerae TaxID=257003 RepID=UPI002FF7F5E0